MHTNKNWNIKTVRPNVMLVKMVNKYFEYTENEWKLLMSYSFVSRVNLKHFFHFWFKFPRKGPEGSDGSRRS